MGGRRSTYSATPTGYLLASASGIGKKKWRNTCSFIAGHTQLLLTLQAAHFGYPEEVTLSERGRHNWNIREV